MFHEGNTHEKAFRKSAKTVGNVIGNYHPHGDTSVYEAMVRMSQDWKLRHMLVEMQGNNGSVDGDSAAAMRYTEARLSAIAGQMLRDLGKTQSISYQTSMILNRNQLFYPQGIQTCSSTVQQVFLQGMRRISHHMRFTKCLTRSLCGWTNRTLQSMNYDGYKRT